MLPACNSKLWSCMSLSCLDHVGFAEQSTGAPNCSTSTRAHNFINFIISKAEASLEQVQSGVYTRVAGSACRCAHIRIQRMSKSNHLMDLTASRSATRSHLKTPEWRGVGSRLSFRSTCAGVVPVGQERGPSWTLGRAEKSHACMPAHSSTGKCRRYLALQWRGNAFLEDINLGCAILDGVSSAQVPSRSPSH